MFNRTRQHVLERENRLLREALDWYACKVNWRRKGINPKGAPRKWEKSPAAYDRGTRARVVMGIVDARRAGPLRRLFRRLMGPRAPVLPPVTVPAPRAVPANVWDEA